MVIYRFLGKGKTDANGVAHLTEDAEGNTVSPPGLVGQGLGLLDVVASLDKPVGDGSIVSQPTTVMDTLFYCNGFENDHNANWFNGGFTLSRDDTGTTLTKTSGANFIPSTTDTASSSWSTLLKQDVPVVVEFEIVSGSGINFRAYNNSNALIFYKGMSSGLWKFVLTSNSVECYKDNVSQTISGSNYDSKCYFAFTGSGSAEATIKFKNLRIYTG